MDKDAIEQALGREDVQEAIDLAIFVRGDPKDAEQRQLVVARVRRALANYDESTPLVAFVTEVARRSLGA